MYSEVVLSLKELCIYKLDKQNQALLLNESTAYQTFSYLVFNSKALNCAQVNCIKNSNKIILK
jgi:hypothetical protein